MFSLSSVDNYLHDFCLFVCENNLRVLPFLINSLMILSNYKIDSISFIYGVYWRMEKLLQSSLGFVFDSTTVFDLEHEFSPVFRATFS